MTVHGTFWNKGLVTFKRKSLLSFFHGCSRQASQLSWDVAAEAGFLCDQAVLLGAAIK
jgi:hypothetical protein